MSIIENIKCVKRNGKKVKFDSTKIRDAIFKANKSVGNIYKEKDIDKAVKEIISTIETRVLTMNSPEIGVEEIQDIVVYELMSSLRNIATEYITYRYKREMVRSGVILIEKYKERATSNNIKNANANVDEASSSGKEKEAAADTSKLIAIEFGGLSEKVAKAHKEMLVYQHDLEKAIFGIHNCLFLDFDEAFKKGWRTRNGDVRVPGSFQSASQQIAVLFQCQSQVQFGGVATIHLDTDLAPFVMKSFTKWFRKGLKYIAKKKDSWIKKHFPKSKLLRIEDEEAKSYDAVYAFAMENLEEEMAQSCEALYHNINTLESRPGSQVPFTSVNLGRDTTPEGRLVTKHIFNASLAGIGKNHVTSIFPISIFQYKKGCNANVGEPNYDLFKLAIESTTHRIYPNFINCDFSEANEDPKDKDTLFSGMGKELHYCPCKTP